MSSYGEYSFSKANFIHTLPQKLSLLSIQRSSLDLCLSPLIRLSFYSERLFSFTETPDEISLIIEQETLDQFPSDPSAITISGKTYRALEVWEGGEALDCIGAVRQLALPLEDSCIPCFYLSTYNTDLILVDETDLPQALEVLSKSLQDSLDGHQIGGRIEDDEITESKRLKEIGSLNHTQHEYRLSLLTFLRKESPHLIHPLLNQLLFTSGPRFFNFTATPKEITVITDKSNISSFTSLFNPSKHSSSDISSSVEQFELNLSSSSSSSSSSPSPSPSPSPSNALNSDNNSYSVVPSLVINNDVWVAVEIHSEGDSGHVEGMVSVVSDALYHAKISMYYISTFTTDFFLVHEQDSERTTRTLVPS